MKTTLPSHLYLITELATTYALYKLFNKPKDVLSAFAKGSESFSAVNLRRESLNNALNFNSLEEAKKSDDLIDLSNILSAYGNDFIDINGSQIFFKQSDRDEAQTISLQLHPFLLATGKTHTLLNKNKITIQDLICFAKMIRPGLLSKDNPHKTYADNHIHLNGCHDAGTFILEICNQSFLDTGNSLRNTPLLVGSNLKPSLELEQAIHILRYSFNLINQGLIQELNINPKPQSVDNFTCIKNIINHPERDHSTSRIRSWKDNHFLMKNQSNSASDTIQILFKAVHYYHGKNPVASLFLYYNFLLSFDHELKNSTRSNSVQCRMAIRSFIISANIIRRHLVMSSQAGLSHFTDFFSSSVKNLPQEKWDYDLHAYHNVALMAGQYNTLKVSPSTFNSSNLKQHLAKYLKVTLDHKRSNPLLEKLCHQTRIGQEDQKKYSPYEDFVINYVIHFIKKSDRRKRKYISGQISDYRHLHLRNSIKKQSLKLDRFLCDPKSQKSDLLQVLIQDKSWCKKDLWQNKDIYKKQKIDLSQFLVGIDAAGNECDTPPEVFAPSIRFLRTQPKSFKTKSFSQGLKHHSKLRISMHAGEDFNHIVTGLRRIDECVKFCEMGKHDRLGHALALGINPKKWLLQQQEVLISQEEYFDNLVWLWGLCGEMSRSYPPALSFRNHYENEIFRLKESLYPNAPTTCSLSNNYGGPQRLPQDFYRAWELRKNCPSYFFHASESLSNSDIIASFSPDKNLCDTATSIYREYHYGDLSDRKTVLSFRFSASTKKPLRKKYLLVSEDELSLYEAIQDYLISKTEENGLILECCPSSNITIAGFPIENHPIFRWFPPKLNVLEDKGVFNQYNLRKSPINCCVNTDDPALFSTDLENEFILLKNAAIEFHGCSEYEAESWIELIRENGLNIFKRDMIR
ncbi:hypothetical protein PQO03_17030 [Lentisphaera profundi]|uniref:Adenosine deaminase domain-containing protein n=1 Tax=Lentisphaera profundi TaxID=1658616 RepID=A0ABY7VU05_9BACT|nr:hypothetical protein [Lentisphaera profundi]WDE97532.1 hypothetical protein PQO03_17030 [Lentisphaera profundi]